ncbi:acyl-CoA dehydrogenase family protein [Streptomyces beihaiensis]|uniref:Acyl-CoA/acyl-ACP dehydrogenase n=1 Tax=Streptomyces beihaiensis TaxID=2984495 RepID=A0ABT3TYF3_9ACTN|nr:acyl-CoA dehydrogenase family protein [Streptomyces beihaiensis]MCX3062074.1 acyl-CoA/acyl-ACP dehydrogenase [Streptomyces beihaiensis]
MRFLLDAEQAEFGRTLDRMLGAADTPSAVRAWACGDHGPGRSLWARLGEAGMFALAVPETYEGVGPLPVELAVAYVEAGRHAIPGPVVETAAVATLLAELPDPGRAKEWLPRIASGEALATLVAAPGKGSGGGFASGPYALDADAADAVFVASGDELRLATGHGPLRPSADPARRLFAPEGGTVVARGSAIRAAVGRATELAALLTAAQALGVGLELLRRTVEYVKRREQFGVPVGSFQAVKHRLADALIGLEFTRPLLFGAALSKSPVDVAAAKTAAGDAAYTAARTALQLHGAVGYTEELDLSLWLRKARPLRDAWGTPAACRARVVRPQSAPEVT